MLVSWITKMHSGITRLGVIEHFSDIIQDNQTSLSKIGFETNDEGISKITDFG